MVLSSRLSIRSSRSARSRKSEFEYGSEFGDDDASAIDDDRSSENDFDDLARRPSGISDSSVASTSNYLDAASRAMSKLQTLHSSPDSDWKRALTQKKSGCVVYVTREKSYVSQGRTARKSHYAPVYKGVLEIEGFAPTAVFAVMGTRKLWDDWYKEGSLVENISDDASLTYMCMKGIAGSSTRDLSLVEKVQGSPTGTICFATTSVVTPKVPRVAGRVRASIALNGWVLEPIGRGTRLSYYLHVNVRTFMPQFAAKKYLARRPTVITRIADYLAAHGAPPMVPHDPEPTSSSDSQETFVGGGAVPMGRKRRGSNASRRSSRSAASSTTGGAVGLPAHVELDKEGKAFEAVQTGFKLFRAMLGSASGGAWRVAKDQDGTRVWMRDREGEKQGEGLPIVKGEGEIEGVTTEQVLGTLMSESARRIWDPRIDSIQLVQLDNGFDQGVYLEANKGIFPSIKPFHHVVGTGVEREDAADSHGPLLVVSRSAKHEADSAPEDSTLAQCDFSGFSLAPAGPHSVHVTRLAQLALGSSARLNAATYKVLTTELALAPRRVGEFIDAYGFAPHFLRWGPGPAELLASAAPGDDIRTGRVTFRVGGGGRGTMREGKQVAWLEWSGKMYPRGLNLVVEPREAVAAVVKVETSAGQVLVQLEWSEKVRDQGATVRLERAQDGEGTEDVYLAGEFVDQTITAGVTGGGGGRGGAAAARARQRDVPSDEARDDKTVAAAAGAGAAAGAAITAAGSAAAARSGSGASGALGGPSPPFLGKAREAGADGRNPTASSFASDSVAVAQTSGSRSSGAIPDNAMLILSKDLYFTQPQVLFMLVVVAAAYAWGKLA